MPRRFGAGLRLLRPTFDQTFQGLLWITLVAAACLMPLQNDTWWHLRAGEEMLAGAFAMTRDEFSFTAHGAFWPNHQWLGELIFYVAYSIGGLPFLTLLAAVCVMAALRMSWNLMCGSTTARLVLVCLGTPSLVLVWTARPHVFTLLLLMATVHLCLKRMLWVLPVVFGLWANLHGGVALGFLVLGAVMFSEAVLVSIRRALTLAPVAAACVVATFATPLGFDLWLAIPESIQKSVANGIDEWRSPSLEWRYVGFWILAVAFAATLARRRRWNMSHHDLVLTTLAVVLLPLALRHSRNITPFALVALPAISRMMDFGVSLRGRSSPERYALNAGMLASCTLAAVIVVAAAWWKPASRLQWTPVSPPIIQAIQHCPGRLYNRFDDGGYVIWFARVPVYVDSRQDPYSLEFLQEHLRHELTGDYESIFQKYDLRCAFLPQASPTAQRMRQDNWIVAASDARWVVFYPPAAAVALRRTSVQ